MVLSNVERFMKRLAPVLGERITRDPELLASVAGDESGLAPQLPAAAVWPQNRDEVVQVAKEAADLGMGLIPRGAGSGKSGAVIPGGHEVVVDLSKMDRILELRPQDLYAVVEPGVITEVLDQSAFEEGFMYPPDPASKSYSTLGGNIATNAGGPRAVKYGVTHRYVWGIEMVLPGGDVFQTGRHSIKGVAGYDLTSLFVGSEGTLGFITQATLHIIPAPRAVETAFLSFPDALSASKGAEAVFTKGYLPSMMELLDKESLDAVRSVSPFRIPENIGAALLVESDGDAEVAQQDLYRMCEIAGDSGASDCVVAQNEKERQAMRRARQLVSSSLKEKFPLKISDDIAVPRSQMAVLMEYAQEEALKEEITFAAYGHIGDGNLHVNLLCDVDDLPKAQGMRIKLMQKAVRMQGTVSGEHGIGIHKRDMLSIEQSQELIDLQRRIKIAFDKKVLMNPNKVF